MSWVAAAMAGGTAMNMAVTSTYPDGRIRGGWEVRSHGYDGNGPVSHR